MKSSPTRYPDFGIIVLAAGASSRMGTSKQLLLINTEPLLLRSIKTALGSGVKNVTVVLGHQEEEHRKVVQHLPVEIIVNKHWANGMGSSLKAGLHHVVHQHPEIKAVIVMVCDQPDITGKHLGNLAEVFINSSKSIVASEYAGTIGVPALFSADHFSEIFLLDDSQGAKKLLEKHRSTIELVNFPGGAIDLDTPSDYNNFLQQETKKPSR